MRDTIKYYKIGIDFYFVRNLFLLGYDFVRRKAYFNILGSIDFNTRGESFSNTISLCDISH